jgi:hypothetical protein
MTEMNRPDLERIRADDLASRVRPFGDAARWRMATVHAPALLAYAERLEAEVERLRGLVRGGFVEALDLACDHSLTTKDHNLLWRDSDTRAALNEQEKTDD